MPATKAGPGIVLQKKQKKTPPQPSPQMQAANAAPKNAQ
jgi:hypothetical protein